MRYIRDIIKEQQSEQNAGSSGAGQASDDFSRPLSLENPTFPDDRRTKTAENDASDEGAAPMDETKDKMQAGSWEDPVSPTPQIDDTRTWDIEPLDLHEADGAATAHEAVDFEANDNTPLKTNHDPFDRIRQSADKPIQNKPSVSALRTPQPPKQMQPLAEKAPQPAADQEVEHLTPLADALQPTAAPAPSSGGGLARSGRVRTRLLGFTTGSLGNDDPFQKNTKSGSDFPVGWLVVVSELGRGASFSLHDGVTTVGRGTDQTVCLDFGDNSISRENHISIAFDAEQRKFFIGHGGKANLVRLNNTPLLSTEELSSKDMIRLGETTLRFIAFCDDDFNWDAQSDGMAQRA
ncbi:MAG: FHA domain-containing protein [Pseudomonadota bacterium]